VGNDFDWETPVFDPFVASLQSAQTPTALALGPGRPVRRWIRLGRRPATSWHHIILEDIYHNELASPLPVCLAGKGLCPYEGRDVPDRFTIEEANARLRSLAERVSVQ
jgi:hypothetical protein